MSACAILLYKKNYVSKLIFSRDLAVKLLLIYTFISSIIICILFSIIIIYVYLNKTAPRLLIEPLF